MGLEGLGFLQPEGGTGVAGHAEVAPGGEGDGAYLGAVGQAGALELLGEEAAVEGNQPLFYYIGAVLALEGPAGHGVDFAGAEAEAEDVVEEEVVELVGAYQLFGFLGDLAVLGGQQLGADGGG